MDDDGRRSRRTFEPPPWERDQFEELARRKAQESAKAEAAAAAQRAAAVREAVPDAPADGAGSQALRPEPAKESPALSQAKIDAMLLELAGEEVPAIGSIRRAGMVASWTLSALGAAMLVFGMLLLSRGGTTGFAGAAMVLAIGAFVFGFAVWLGFRAGRGQGS